MSRQHAPVIEVAGLRRRYGGSKGFEAVRGVDFSVADGELFALLGTNGAGKTSTLEVVEGLARPSDGQVRVLGGDPYAERRAVRPLLGIMLQSGGFPSELTVGEAARMWAGTLSWPRPVTEALEMVGMNDRFATVVKQLSGGERRRLDLALALLGRPDVLFLDEPTTGLDPESRRDAWHLVRGLRDAGTTIVLTTHYLEEAEQLADRIAIMHRGEVVREGTLAQVVAGHPSVIRFDQLPVELPELTDAEITTRNGVTTLHTQQLQSTLTQLLNWAAHRDITLSGLHADTASLESVFLSVAGDRNTSEETEGARV